MLDTAMEIEREIRAERKSTGAGCAGWAEDRLRDHLHIRLAGADDKDFMHEEV